MGPCPMAWGSHPACHEGLIINPAPGSPRNPSRAPPCAGTGHGTGTASPRGHPQPHSPAPWQRTGLGTVRPRAPAGPCCAMPCHPAPCHAPGCCGSPILADHRPQPPGPTYALEGRRDDVVDLGGHLGVAHGAGRGAPLALLLLTGSQRAVLGQHNLGEQSGGLGGAPCEPCGAVRLPSRAPEPRTGCHLQPHGSSGPGRVPQGGRPWLASLRLTRGAGERKKTAGRAAPRGRLQPGLSWPRGPSRRAGAKTNAGGERGPGLGLDGAQPRGVTLSALSPAPRGRDPQMGTPVGPLSALLHPKPRHAPSPSPAPPVPPTCPRQLPGPRLSRGCRRAGFIAAGGPT